MTDIPMSGTPYWLWFRILDSLKFQVVARMPRIGPYTPFPDHETLDLMPLFAVRCHLPKGVWR